ncbi:MAG: ribonuclease J [Acidimicrobiia bacterium]|nr:ribonuclease J [Acidimicrobiia bacterium]MYE66976.1 ribonuclease J [Acidimicrobiia bacterium]
MAEQVRVTFLGGLGDIGRNCAAIETGEALLLLDCGLMFAGEDRPGVESVLPDLSYVFERSRKVVGCIATHGHEDHVGALSHLLARVRCDIYGTPFTLGLARRRVTESGYVDRAQFIPVADGERVRIGPFDCEFVPVTHSVPGGVITAISTPQGVLLHSCDFKLDFFPVDGRRTDLARIGAISQDPGVRLLLADSTNAEQPGSSRSESDIGPVLSRVFAANSGRRVVAACFASHLHRVQQIIVAAAADGRFVATLGLSMKKNVSLGRELGLLRAPDGAFVDISETAGIPPGELCVISTGSQAEERSSLASAAAGDSRWIQIGADDTVVLSSNPIPGNEFRVSRMINDLIERGARVVHSGEIEIHTSGHGRQDELAALHQAASPEWFVPVHGELRHLRAHAALARRLGMAEERVLVARDGDQLVLTDAGIQLAPGACAGDHVLVHGPFTGADRGVLDERLTLGRQGVVVATVAVDFKAAAMVGEPQVTSRGWLDEPDADPLEVEIEKELAAAVAKLLAAEPQADAAEVRRVVRRTVGTLVANRSQRRPTIVPLVVPAG